MTKPRSGLVAPRKRREKLLEQLEQRKRSSSFEDAVRVLRAWGFLSHRREGNHSQAWCYEDLTVAFHRPHGNSDMDTGAIEAIIDKCEEARIRIEEAEKRNAQEQERR